jgi:hypothetical protein
MDWLVGVGLGLAMASLWVGGYMARWNHERWLSRLLAQPESAPEGEENQNGGGE